MNKNLIKIFFISGAKLFSLAIFLGLIYLFFNLIFDILSQDILKENIYDNLIYGYEKAKIFIYKNITLFSFLWCVLNLWVLFFCIELQEKFSAPSYLNIVLLLFSFLSFIIGSIIVIEYLKTEKVFTAMLLIAIYYFKCIATFQIILKNNKEKDKQTIKV